MDEKLKNVEEIIQRAENELGQIDPIPFSPQAFKTLKERTSENIRSIISESIKVSRRNRADIISASDVEKATEYLNSNYQRKWIRHLGTLGGIFLGTALSNFLSMTTSSQYTTTGVIVSAVLAIIGTFGVAFHIAND